MSKVLTPYGRGNMVLTDAGALWYVEEYGYHRVECYKAHFAAANGAPVLSRMKPEFTADCTLETALSDLEAVMLRQYGAEQLTIGNPPAKRGRKREGKQ